MVPTLVCADLINNHCLSCGSNSRHVRFVLSKWGRPRGSGVDSVEPGSLAGSFIISDANLHDPNFRHSVILIINHDEDGAFGIVVNQRLDATLGQVLPGFAGSAAGGLPIHRGGPVQPQYLFAIYSGLPDLIRSDHVTEPIEHVTFEPAFQSLSDYLKSEWEELKIEERPPVNLYAGYSGWSAGQLEGELRHEAWIVRPAAAKHVFTDDPDNGWRDALSELGGIHKITAETGYKPSMN